MSAPECSAHQAQWMKYDPSSGGWLCMVCLARDAMREAAHAKAGHVEPDETFPGIQWLVAP